MNNHLLLSVNTVGVQQIVLQDEIGLVMCTGIPLYIFLFTHYKGGSE